MASKIYDIIDNFDIFKNRVDTLFAADPSIYSRIYLSFGSKYNTPNLYFSYPQSIQTKPYAANSEYQMIPQFLRARQVDQPDDSRALVIIIDIFNNPTNLQTNLEIINKAVMDENAALMDVIIMDHICNKNFVENVMIFMAEQCIRINISPHKCAFCNYIRFSHPNEGELLLEDMVPKTIQSVLNKREFAKYSACFYQWYGPGVFTYNLIYNYKKFDTFRMMYHIQIMKFMEKSFTNMHLTNHNIFTLSMIDERFDVRTENAINAFYENSYDFRSNSYDGKFVPIKHYTL